MLLAACLLRVAELFRTYDGNAPSHFLGELTKTPEGCRYIRAQDIVGPLAAIVRQHGLEGKDQAILTSLKCALWALVRRFSLVQLESC
jgi:rapamycin-insensitive companion of mTOR